MTIRNLLSITLALCALFTLSACISAPSVISYKGTQIKAHNAATASCTEPYQLTRNCSDWSGAELKVQFQGLKARVAGTEDGKTVMVMTTVATLPTQQQAEQAADVVIGIAAMHGFHVVRVEALAVNHRNSVPGFFLHFDGNVYSHLIQKSVDK
jgi:hypothetical protein